MSASVINRYGLYLAWVVSITAVLGSLYFSEIRGFIPCELCWIQRIFMYPIALILAIAVFREDSSIKFCSPFINNRILYLFLPLSCTKGARLFGSQTM